MLGKKSDSIIYLSRNGLQIFSSENQDLVQIPFKQGLVVNLEVTDQGSLLNQIQEALSTNQMEPKTAILMLSEDVLFTRKIGAITSDARDEQVTDFLNSIPLDPNLVSYKVFTFRGYRLAVATNSELYMSVKRSFESLKWKITYIVPDVIYIRGNLAPQRIMDVLNDKELLDMGNMLTAKIPQVKSKRMVSSFIFIIPIIFLIGFIVFVVVSKGSPTKKLYEGGQVPTSVKLMDTLVISGTQPQEESVAEEPTETIKERKDIKVQVLNGTGVGGLAGTVKADLEKLNYVDIGVGNASSQDFEGTEVAYIKGTPEVYVNELADVLDKTFASVKKVEKTATEQKDFDIIITTGTLK